MHMRMSFAFSQVVKGLSFSSAGCEDEVRGVVSDIVYWSLRSYTFVLYFRKDNINAEMLVVVAVLLR